MFPVPAFVLMFFLSPSFAQVSYTPAVRNTYDSVYRKLDARLTNMVTNPENKIKGIALLTIFRVDTLNKQDLLANSSARDTSTIAGYTPEKILNPDIMIGKAKVSDTSLVLSFSPWFMLGEEIRHVIKGNTVETTYQLWNKSDKVFKTDSGIQDSRNIDIAAQSRLVLSDSDAVVGETLYGSAETTTRQYAELHNANFKNGILQLRVTYNYVFKLFVHKDDGY